LARKKNEPEAETVASPAEKPRRNVTEMMTEADGRAAVLRSLILNCILVFVMVLSLPILYREMTDDRVLIAPLSVPQAVGETGLDGTVVANRLWDAWSRLNHEVATAKETRDALPESERIKFSIPDSGLSFDSFIHHLRALLGMPETIVTGELVCVASPCDFANTALRLRVSGKDNAIIQLPKVGDTAEDLYWRNAMAEVLLRVDPVRGILATRLVNDGKPGVNERAVAELRKLARAHQKDSDWALAYAGTLLGQDGDYAGAQASFDDALKRNANFAFAWRMRSSAAYQLGHMADARDSIDHVLAIDPKDAKALVQLGLLEEKAGDFDKALADYRKALDVDPNAPDPHVQIARVLISMNKPMADAKVELQSAVEIDPDYIDAREILGLLASATDDVDEAIKQQTVIVRLKPTDPEAQSRLGVFLDQKGKFPEAIEAYRKAITLAPETAKYHQEEGKTLLKMSQFADALVSFQAAEKLQPSLQGIWLDIGDAQRQLGNKDTAIAAYQQFVALEPKSVYVAVANAWLRILNAPSAQ